jgi:hypothetical protein
VPSSPSAADPPFPPPFLSPTAFTPYLRFQSAVFLLFLCFTFLHLFCNYKAVTSLEMDQLNARRAEVVIDGYLKNGTVLSPRVANKREPLFRCECGEKGSVGPVRFWLPSFWFVCEFLSALPLRSCSFLPSLCFHCSSSLQETVRHLPGWPFPFGH